MNYPYLVLSIVLMGIAAGVYLCFPRYRKALLISGGVSMPCCLTTYFFVPEYWQPVRVFDFSLGIEDLMFSFSTGIIALYVLALRYPGISISTSLKAVSLRYLKICLFGIAVTAVMLQTQMMVMHQALLGIFIIAAVLGSLKRWIIAPAMLSGVFFTLFYGLILMSEFFFFPAFHQQWTAENLSGLTLAHVPVEELYWAFAFGGCWVIVMAFLLDLRLKPITRHYLVTHHLS
jgi:hypothetical protein